MGLTPFYWQGRTAQKKLILLWIEESLREKEKVDPDNLTIEHVLPQTLTDATRAAFAMDLEEGADVTFEHERLVHTLGNLTLSGYNSELSNHAYSEKRPMLAESGLRMNLAISQNARWGRAQILGRGREFAERIIQLWPGPNESLVVKRDHDSEHRRAIAATLAAIPAGRWTSYGEVAVIVGTHPLPVGSAIANHPMPNPWRVLQAAGTVSEQFRWTDDGRTEDPHDLLRQEGVHFDKAGKADPTRFMDAVELATVLGLDTDPAVLRRRRRRRVRKDAVDPEALAVQQVAFWELVQKRGAARGSHSTYHRQPRRRQYYSVHPTGTPYEVNMVVNPTKNRVYVELYIANGEEAFAPLRAESSSFEAALGYEVEWREQPETRASRVVRYREGDFRQLDQQEELADWLVRTGDDFVRVFIESEQLTF